ncbi:CLUMA_CG005445, isoform A [Clunio marinus]|uniref:CLUMA_CG005445, isoform A n=1 Tax=Clunio marinus TaxID=568069 RepID=A0A1J1HWT7_9DIPT|nr:CLUMA_CG005445, isoform A [Clunio marinus]
MNWVKYCMNVKNKVKDFWSEGDIKSCKDLDFFADKLTNILYDCYQNNNKPIKKILTYKSRWQTPTLLHLRKVSLKATYRANNSNSVKLKSIAKSMSKNYKEECKKAKFLSWKEKMEEIDSIKEASRFQKIFEKNSSSKIGSLKNDNGAYTQNHKESLTLLLVKHFPECVLINNEKVKAPIYYSMQNCSWTNSHSNALSQKVEAANINHTNDNISKFYSYKRFKIDISGTDNIAILINNKNSIWYTDGSIKNEKVGIGIYCPKKKLEWCKRLPNYCSIVQAEIKAIQMVSDYYNDNKIMNEKVTIFTDSQSALRALMKFEIQTEVMTLELLGLRKNDLRIAISILTGHSCLNQFCKIAPETMSHILFDCKSLTYQRYAILGQRTIDNTLANTLPLNSYIRLIKKIGLDKCMTKHRNS